MKIYKTITVHGHVQGVGFRYYTKVKADFLGIKGADINALLPGQTVDDQNRLCVHFDYPGWH